MKVVVGAALIDGGRVLAGERATPAELAGRWEFPGGKVEDGESEQEALVRECREELGVEIVVGERIGGDLVTAGGAVLRIYGARVVAGEPDALEHRRLRWVAADELASLPWLDTNRPVLIPLGALLRISS